MKPLTLNLTNSVIRYLKEHPEEKFTARQIAEWLFTTYPAECQAKKERSIFLETDADLLRQIAAEIGAHHRTIIRKCPEIKITEGRPRRYYYSNLSDSEEVATVERKATTPEPGENPSKVREHALYSILSKYLRDEFGIYSKRIDEKRSSNKRGPNGNRWLYPDLVGMEDLGKEWHREVRDCVTQYFDKRTRLWSFEVKGLINRANVRECFFQTVSHSS